MRTLTITDVGPVTKTATIEYKRFCILIGPQSNGKSTIAKILSTCLWLEKEACTSLKSDIIKDGESFKNLVEGFHRMHNYIHPDRSVIEYESPYIRIVYNKSKFSISFNSNLEYKRIKISYVPSDRNVVTMKDIEKRDLKPTNFRSFLFDWLETNRNFDERHKVPILNLGIKYYFDANAKSRMDMLTHENGVTYDIPLYDASSGMQSLVPMTVLMHYLVSDYFTNYGKDISFEQQSNNNNLARAITELLTVKDNPQQTSYGKYAQVEAYCGLLQDPTGNDVKETMDKMKDLYNNLAYPQSISFILEEPERNLFPETQVSLFNDIVSLCNGKHPSSAFITTHSPYLLAAANISLFAGKLANLSIDEKAIADCIGTDIFINPEDFTAYSVSEGTCTSLLDDNTHLIKENELDSASEYNAEVFDKLYRLYTKKLRQ